MFWQSVKLLQDVKEVNQVAASSQVDITKERRVAVEPLSSLAAMPSLCVFSKQDNTLVGWSDTISAYSLMNFKSD